MEFIVTIQEPEIQVVYVATQGEQGVPGLIWIDAGWTDATDYVVDNALEHNGSSYRAFAAHTSSAATEPGVGVDWETVWKILAEKGDTGSGGDMTKAVYDPGAVNDDAFDMDNMSEGATNKILTQSERGRIPTADQRDALDSANAPTALNPVATIADIGGGGGGAYNLVAKHVSDGTETQITFAGLSGSKYFKIVFDLSVAMVGSAVISFTVNGDASSSGYNRSRLIGTGANNATNDSEFIRGQSTWTGWHGSLDISVNDGLSAHGTWGRFGGGQGTLNQYVIEKPGAGFNGITQIDIFSSIALTTGMTFRIFEVQESP